LTISRAKTIRNGSLASLTMMVRKLKSLVKKKI